MFYFLDEAIHFTFRMSTFPYFVCFVSLTSYIKLLRLLFFLYIFYVDTHFIFKETKHVAHFSVDTSLSSDGAESVVLPRSEVILRLRDRGEPVLLFGESELDAFKRLRKCEISEPEINKVRICIVAKVL